MEALLNPHLNHNRLPLSTSTCLFLVRYSNLPSRIRFLTRKLISSKFTINQFRHRRLLSSIVDSHMETNESQQTESTANDSNSKEEKEKSQPPPPEKPEAGDCCGSGCVRCVWDVYYEELEEYNKLYNSKS